MHQSKILGQDLLLGFKQAEFTAETRCHTGPITSAKSQEFSFLNIFPPFYFFRKRHPPGSYNLGMDIVILKLGMARTMRGTACLNRENISRLPAWDQSGQSEGSAFSGVFVRKDGV